MNKKVAIIGSGISGLFAAWACEHEGIQNVEIFSTSSNKPNVAGFQYLHNSCDLKVRSSYLVEKVIQSEVPRAMCSSLYSLKVYGEKGIVNSIDKIPDNPREIWDLSQAVNILWSKYGKNIIQKPIKEISDLKKIKADKIFWTVPLIQFFTQCKYSIAHVTTFSQPSEINQVFYDISPDIPTYRFGIVFGNFFIESTQRTSQSTEVRKVINVDKSLITGFPPNVIMIGRYGEWDKNILVDDVFYKVIKELNGKKI